MLVLAHAEQRNPEIGNSKKQATAASFFIWSKDSNLKDSNDIPTSAVIFHPQPEEYENEIIEQEFDDTGVIYEKPIELDIFAEDAWDDSALLAAFHQS